MRLSDRPSGVRRRVSARRRRLLLALVVAAATAFAGLVVARTVFAVGLTCNWTGGTANFTASTANWSCGAFPGAGDTITVNAGVLQISTAQTVGAVQIGGGTVQQTAAAGNLNVTTASGGTGQFLMTSGGFTGISGATLQIQGDVTISGGTFTGASGTVQLTGNSSNVSITTATTFASLNMAATAGQSKTFTTAGQVALTVTGTLTLTSGTLAQQGGTAAAPAAGTINYTGASIAGSASTSLDDGSTALVRVTSTGTTNFPFTLNSGTTGTLPAIEIAQSGAGATTLASATQRLTQSWTVTSLGSGGLNAQASRLVLAPQTSTTMTFSPLGSETYNAIEIGDRSGTGNRGAVNIPSGKTLTLARHLVLNDGTLTGAGTLRMTAANLNPSALALNSTFDGGTGTIEIAPVSNTAVIQVNGCVSGGAQTGMIVNCNGTVNDASTASLPNMIFNAAAARSAPTLGNTLRTVNNWTSSGATLPTPGASTVVFAPAAAGSLTIAGTHTLAGVTFKGSDSAANVAVAGGTTLTATGLMDFEGGTVSGALVAQGDLKEGSGAAGGTGALTINGAATQTFQAGTATTSAGDLPALTINKTGGSLSLGSATIRTLHDWTYTAGTVTTGTSTTIFSGPVSISGSPSFNNLTLNGIDSHYTIPSGTVTANGTATLTDGFLDTGTLAAQGNVVQGSGFDGGTGSLTINNTSGAQTLSGTATLSAGTLPPLTIAKSAQTLTLSGDVRTNQNVTVTSGTVTADGTSTFFANGITLAGAAAFNNLTVQAATSLSGGNVSVGGTLNFTGGKLTTGANTVAVTNTATGAITNASESNGYVNGNLVRSLPNGGSGTYTWAVGGPAHYSPIAITFPTLTQAATQTIAASATVAAAPHKSNWPVDQSKYVNRYWTLTNSATPVTWSGSATLAPTYNTLATSDLTGSPTETSLQIALDTTPGGGSGTWTKLTTDASAPPTPTGSISSLQAGDTTVAIGQADGTAPTGGSVTVGGGSAFSSSLTVAVSKTNFSDAESGIATNVVTRSDAQSPSSAGVCPGSGYTGANGATLPNDTAPTDGKCYRYTLTGTDNAGNTATASATILVDTTAPTGGSVTPGTSGFSSSTTVPVAKVDFSDAESGMTSNVVTRSAAQTRTGVATCPSNGYTGSNAVTPPNDTVPTDDRCYQYTLTGTNQAGVTATTTAIVLVDATAPVADGTPLAFSSLTNAFFDGTRLFIRPAAGGAYTVTASFTDSQTGVASYNDASGDLGAHNITQRGSGASAVFTYTFGATATGAGTGSIKATNAAGGESAATTYSVVSDTTGPAGGAVSIGGFSSSLSVSPNVTALFAETASASASGLKATGGNTLVRTQAAPASAGTCPSAGSITGGSTNISTNLTSTGTVSDTVPTTGLCYRYTLTGTDNVGNTTTTSAVVLVDTTVPVAGSPALAFSSQTNAFWDGSQLFIRPAAGGAYTVTADFTDDQSAVATYNDASGDLGTHNITQRGSGASPVFNYTFGATATGGGTGSIKATNNAGGESAAATYSVVADTAGPTGGSLTVNAVSGTASAPDGAFSYSTSGAFSISATAFSADAGSGFASSRLWKTTGTGLAGDTCSTFGAPVDITGTTTQSGLTTGCYRYELIGTDNVGNQTKLITTVKVDTAAPSNTLAVTENPGSADQAAAGSVLYYRPAGAGGSFRVTATAADGETGIAKVNFPDPGSGVTRDAPGAPGDDTASPYLGDYTWATSATATGLNTVGAFDKATNQTNADFRLVSDSTAPAFATPALTANGTDGAAVATSSSDADGTYTVTYTAPTEPQNTTSSGLASWTLVRDEATLTGSTCGAFSNPTDLSAQSSPISESLPTTICYRYTLTGTDNVGNTASRVTIVKVGVDGDGPLVPLTITSATRSLLVSTGAHAYRLYYSPLAAGNFTFSTTATDATGVGDITFGPVSPTTGWTQTAVTRNGGGATSFPTTSNAYSFSTAATANNVAINVDSVDTAPALNQSQEVVTLVRDVTGPSAGGTLVATGTTNGWSTSGTFGITVTAFSEAQGAAQSGLASNTLTRETGSLVGNVCSYTGSSTIAVSTVSESGLSTGCYRYTLTAVDNVGNAATPTVAEIKVDTTAPSTPALLLSNGGDTDSFADTTTRRVYLRTNTGANGGSFTVGASTTDADSNIKNVTFPTLTDVTGGGTVTPPTTFQGIYVWTTSSTATTGATVTARNNADNTSTRTFDVVVDNNAPTLGALTANGTAADGSGTSGSYLTTGAATATLAIGSRTDWQETMSATESGIVSSTLTMTSATLSANECGTFGSPVTISGTTSQTVDTGKCYRLTLTGIDNVGNSVSISTTVKVDTSAPTAPVPSITNGGDNDSYVSGTRVYLRTTGGSGSFTVSATTGDPQTAIDRVNFPDLSGSGITGGGDDTSDPYSTSYSWNGSSTAASNPNITSFNRAGLSSTTPFDVAIDNTAPTGGAFSANGTAADGAGTTSYLNSGTTLAISGRADWVEAQAPTASGLASSTLTVRSAQLSANGCVGGFGSADTIAPGTTSIAVTTGNCYLLTLTGVDNAGNTVSVSTTVKVDTTAPSSGSVSYHDGQTTLDKATVTFSQGTDSESGIQTVDIQRASATFSTSCGTFSGYSSIATNQASPYTDTGVAAGNCYRYRVVVTNNAGLATTTTSSQTFIRVAASVFALSAGASSNAFLISNALYVGPGGGTFQLELNAAGQGGVTSATWQGKSGASLSSSPTTNTTTSTAPYQSAPYTWTGAVTTDSITVTRNPGGTVDTLSVALDNTAPTGTIDYPDTVLTSTSVSVNTSISDGSGSGVASTQVERAVADYDGTSCAAFSGFSTITLSGGVDNTVTENHCYQYRAIATDRVGNVSPAITSANVAKIPDLTKPSFSSASTNAAGTVLTILMSEPLQSAGVTLQASSFAVTYSGGSTITPTSVAINGSSIELTLPAPGPNNRQVVQVAYTKPGTAAQRIADAAGNYADNFGPSSVTNGTTDTVAPTLVSAAVTADGTQVVLTFSEPLATTPPAAGAFTVRADGAIVPVGTVSISGSTVTLTLGALITAGQVVTTGYAVPGVSPLSDNSGTAPAASAYALQPVTNNATSSSVPPPPAPPLTPDATPQIVSSSPADGATTTSVSQISLEASDVVSWTLTVSRPDGSSAAFNPPIARTATLTFGATAAGLYTVSGTIINQVTGSSADFTRHFTVFVPAPGGGTGGDTAPPVQATVQPNDPGTLTTSDGAATASWPAGAFGGDAVILEMDPTPATDFPNLPPNSVVIEVTAHRLSNGQSITQLGGVIELVFRNISPDVRPVVSSDGAAWRDIPEINGTQLPAGQADGFFRDAQGGLHLLTRHLTLFALTGQTAQTKLAMRIISAPRVWSARDFVAVHLDLTAPARVRSWFVADATGRTIPNTAQKTPTLRSGVTILRLRLPNLEPGSYRLQVQAAGAGQVTARTARLRIVKTQPWLPTAAAAKPLGIVVVSGTRPQPVHQLQTMLGPQFSVQPTLGSLLFTAVDPRTTRTAGVVVDLDAVPLTTVAGLHSVFPELPIVGLASDPATAKLYRRAGAAVVLAKPASAWAVREALRQLVLRRP
jgi:hypothetical protein